MTYDEILKASKVLEKEIVRTPIVKADWLSNHIHGSVFMKLENLQPTGSFKIRGAYVAIQRVLKNKKKCQGVVTISIGNHGDAIAYCAKKMGLQATIIMPENTPTSQIERTKSYGASVILHGKSLSEAQDFALQLIRCENLEFIHPFDDPLIISGQGTVGIELLKDIPDLDTIVVPIGGGGLISGIGIVAKYLNPDIQLIGVQSDFSPTVAHQLFPNSLCHPRNEKHQTLAGALDISFTGRLNLDIMHDLLDNIFIVNESMIKSAIEDLIFQNKIVSEGAGACGVAALMAYPEFFHKKRVGTVICGGNIDARVLKNLLTYNLLNEGKFIRFKIEILEQPGILGHLTQIIGKAGGQVFEINQKRCGINEAPPHANAVVETRDTEHIKSICNALEQAGHRTWIEEN